MFETVEEKYNGVLKNKVDNKRNKEVIKTSVIGIVANVFLALFKAIVGIFSGSIAIILDAVNNISDVASSLITIIGTKLASKSPDREHPFGHGRIEYLSAMIISLFVLYVGVTSLLESIKAMFSKDTPNYDVAVLIIIGVATVIKIILGSYIKNKGKKLNSSSLVNSGNDSILDAVISASTLIAAIVFLLTDVSLEAYLAAVISVIIIKSGVDMLKDSIYSILGARVDVELIKSIKETILEFSDVSGVYDLVFNNYGPNSYTGSLHIEIPDTYTVDKLDELTRDIALRVYEKHNVIIYAIGIYSVNTKDERSVDIRNEVSQVLAKYENVLQMHGFNCNNDNKTIRFDIVISFDEQDKNALYERIYQELSELYPEYKITIALDLDFSVS